MEYDELNLLNPKDIEKGEEVLYREYEHFLRKIIKEKKQNHILLNLKKDKH